MTRLRLAWLRARGRVKVFGRPRLARGVRIAVARGGRVEVRGRPRLARGVRIVVAGGGRVVLENGCAIGERSRIEAVGGTVRIGRGVSVGERCVLVALAGIDVGDGCVVGDWVVIADAEPSYDDAERPVRLQALRAEPVRIGERARVGPHAAIMRGAAIAAGAEVAPYAVVGGEPAARGDQTRAPRSSP